MKAFSRSGLVAALVAGSILPISLASAQEIEERTIKLAFANAKGSAHDLGAQRFAEIVDEKSGGKLEVKLYPGGVLGGEAVVASSMQGGTIEMSMMGPGLLTGMDADFGVFDTPFLFDDFKEVDAVLDGPVGTQLLDKLPEKSLIGLCYWESGFRNITNNERPVQKLEDIQGLKIRTIQNPVFLDTINALGANAVPMPFTELYTALETGAVDGQEGPYTTILTSKIHEVQEYLSDTRHIYGAVIVLVGKKFWDQLTNDEKQLLQDSCKEARDYERSVNREMSPKSLTELQAEGMEFNEISPEEMARMRAKIKPVVGKHSAEVGDDLVAQAYAAIEKARQPQ